MKDTEDRKTIEEISDFATGLYLAQANKSIDIRIVVIILRKNPAISLLTSATKECYPVAGWPDGRADKTVVVTNRKYFMDIEQLTG